MCKKLFSVRRIVETEMVVYAEDEYEAEEIADKFCKDEISETTEEIVLVESYDDLPFSVSVDYVPWGTDDTYLTIAKILGEP